MSEIQMSQMLAQMQSVARQAGMQPQAPALVTAEQTQFARLLRAGLDRANAHQQEARSLRTAFEQGESSVSLAETMVAAQKASVAFEAVNQVRNRLLSAYQEVMRMPI